MKNTSICPFFKLSDNDAKDVELIEPEQSNIIFAFDELYSVIEIYIRKLNTEGDKDDKMVSKFTRVFKSVKKVTGEKFIEYLVTKSADYARRLL